MGILSSFKGQIGRDTGKVVSNLVWKDKHASVYRRAESRKQEALDLKKKQLEAELEQKELDRESEQEKHEQERLDRISEKIGNRIRQVNECDIPEERKALVDTLNQLIVLFKANPFKDELNNKEHKISNTYSDVILIKYEQALMTFESFYAEDIRLEYYSKLLKSFKKERIIKKNIGTILLIIGIVSLFSFFGTMAYLQKHGLI